MKRTLPGLLLVLALVVGGAAFYYVQKSGHSPGAPLVVAGYLPQDTLLLLAIPDPGQTASRWRTTDLYKIWTEPDVQAFLARPLSKIPSNQSVNDALAQANKVQPTNLFLALTALDEQSNQPHLVGGFQFQGASSEVDRLIAPAKDAWREKYPAGRADLIDYQGHSVETFATNDGSTIASVYLGDWYLLANDVALLEATIDRIEHRGAENAPALVKDGDFQKVCAKLPNGYETLAFGRVQPFMSRIFALAAASGQPISGEARKRADKARAFGVTTKIEEGRMRDTLYYFAPGLGESAPRLNMGTLSLASSDTLLYWANVFQVPDHIDLPPDSGADSSPLANPAAMARAFGLNFEAKGITFQTVRAALGSEMSFQLDWQASRPQPTAIGSVEVKDRAGAGKIVAALTSEPLGESAWEVQQAGALTLHMLTLPNIEAFHPTLAVTNQSVILGLTTASVKDAAGREQDAAGQKAAPRFNETETYKAAVAGLEKPNQSFAYVDSRTLFERIYGVVKPAAMLGAAFLYPQASDYVELGKLPPTEAISKHLSPIVMSASLDGEGELIESTGSVTIFQAGAVLLGGAAAGAAPLWQSRFGGLLPFAAGPATVQPGSGFPAPAPAGLPGVAPGVQPSLVH